MQFTKIDKNKPLTINLKLSVSRKNPTSLNAIGVLKLIGDKSYHKKHDKRHPEAAYVLSLKNLCEKITKCCVVTENYYRMNFAVDFDEADKYNDLLVFFQDCLYAAAEHFNVCLDVSKSFFEEAADVRRSRDHKKLYSNLKQHTEFARFITNKIKHDQNELRPYIVQMTAGTLSFYNLGFFLEQYHSGSVNKNAYLMNLGVTALSIPMTLWYLVKMIIDTSESLCNFFGAHLSDSLTDIGNTVFEPLMETIIHACRIPLFSLDEGNSLIGGGISVRVDKSSREKMKSGIYGSAGSPWMPVLPHTAEYTAQIWKNDTRSRTMSIIGHEDCSMQRIFLLNDDNGEMIERII